MSRRRPWKKQQDYSGFSEFSEEDLNNPNLDDRSLDNLRNSSWGDAPAFYDRQKDMREDEESDNLRSGILLGHRLILVSSYYRGQTEIEIHLWVDEELKSYSWGILLFDDLEERACETYENMTLMSALKAFYSIYHEWFKILYLIIEEPFYKANIIPYVYKTYEISALVEEAVQSDSLRNEDTIWRFLYSIIELSSMPPRNRYNPKDWEQNWKL